MSAPSRGQIFGAFAAIYLLWGGTFLAIRYAVADVPPLLTIGVRCLGGAALLFAWLWARGQGSVPTAAQWRTSIVAGAFLFLGCHGVLAWAEQRVSSGEAALFMTAIPLWLVSLDAVRVRRLPSANVLAGLALGVVGVGILTVSGEAWSGSTGRPHLADRECAVLGDRLAGGPARSAVRLGGGIHRDAACRGWRRGAARKRRRGRVGRLEHHPGDATGRARARIPGDRRDRARLRRVHLAAPGHDPRGGGQLCVRQSGDRAGAGVAGGGRCADGTRGARRGDRGGSGGADVGAGRCRCSTYLIPSAARDLARSSGTTRTRSLATLGMR